MAQLGEGLATITRTRTKMELVMELVMVMEMEMEMALGGTATMLGSASTTNRRSYETAIWGCSCY